MGDSGQPAHRPRLIDNVLYYRGLRVWFALVTDEDNKVFDGCNSDPRCYCLSASDWIRDLAPSETTIFPLQNLSYPRNENVNAPIQVEALWSFTRARADPDCHVVFETTDSEEIYYSKVYSTNAARHKELESEGWPYYRLNGCQRTSSYFHSPRNRPGFMKINPATFDRKAKITLELYRLKSVNHDVWREAAGIHDFDLEYLDSSDPKKCPPTPFIRVEILWVKDQDFDRSSRLLPPAPNVQPSRTLPVKRRAAPIHPDPRKRHKARVIPTSGSEDLSRVRNQLEDCRKEKRAMERRKDEELQGKDLEIEELQSKLRAERRTNCQKDLEILQHKMTAANIRVPERQLEQPALRALQQELQDVRARINRANAIISTQLLGPSTKEADEGKGPDGDLEGNVQPGGSPRPSESSSMELQYPFA